MEERIRKQSSFYQSRVNQAKLGAYYTDLEHCKWISGLLEFPAEKEVCCLEPSIGDASAVIRVTEREVNRKVLIFGVEINRITASLVMENPLVEDCICGNFLTDVIINKNAFSFCFANPPYGEEDGNRLEVLFLNKLVPYLMEHAVLVFVIPFYVLKEKAFLSAWNRNFSTECCYRFHEGEYKKWKQVVLIGRKVKQQEGEETGAKESFEAFKTPEEVTLLPENYTGDRIKVFPSCGKNISDFKNKVFDAQKARKILQGNQLEDMVISRIGQQQFITDRLSRPPIMPNAGQMYLMAISGAGQGRVGTEEAKDQHLQRGIVMNVEEAEVRQDEEGSAVVAVQKFTRISFQIVENNGVIHTL